MAVYIAQRPGSEPRGGQRLASVRLRPRRGIETSCGINTDRARAVYRLNG